MKNPLTSAGIELATFRFLGQHLNHCATSVPQSYVVVTKISKKSSSQRTSKHHWLLRYGMLVSSLQQIALCGFHACQHKCSLNTLTSAVYYRFLLTDVQVLLEDVTFHQRLHMWFMKARRGTALSQREPDFRSTVDWTGVPSQVACTITWLQSSGLLPVGDQRRSVTLRWYR